MVSTEDKQMSHKCTWSKTLRYLFLKKSEKHHTFIQYSFYFLFRKLKSIANKTITTEKFQWFPCLKHLCTCIDNTYITYISTLTFNIYTWMTKHDFDAAKCAVWLCLLVFFFAVWLRCYVNVNAVYVDCNIVYVVQA